VCTGICRAGAKSAAVLGYMVCDVMDELGGGEEGSHLSGGEHIGGNEMIRPHRLHNMHT
jgi:hypothetical protein